MTVPPFVLVIVLVVFGFLCGATLYFYDQSRTATVSQNHSKTTSFTGTLPQSTTTTTQDQALQSLTKPDAPKGRLSYPTNSYSVQPHETLFALGAKFELPWSLIMRANGLTNENVIQAGFDLAIPALDHQTDYYRINFTLNNDVATSLNQQLRSQTASDYFDPVKVAKLDGIGYFSLTKESDYGLSNQDLSNGTAVVTVKQAGTTTAVVGLFQPKVKGKNGLWAIAYVEDQKP